MITAALPKTPQIQKPMEGRSRSRIVLVMAVVSGRMPNTTPPCEAGTNCMATVINTGKPKITPKPASQSPFHCNRVGRGCDVIKRIGSPTKAASIALPAATK